MEKPQRRLTNSELVDLAMEKLEKRLGGDDLKGTIGDLIRLLQLQRDMGLDQPTQVTVRWVDKNEK